MSKNNLIYSEGNKRITDISSDKLTHYLRYKNDSILISYKTLNKDNPKLNCRLKGLIKFSPKRIILDNKLETKISSYIFKSANKKNTIIFYNDANYKKIKLFKKKGIQLIKANLRPNKHFQLNLVLKKVYALGCRNLLVEGGKELSNSFFDEIYQVTIEDMGYDFIKNDEDDRELYHYVEPITCPTLCIGFRDLIGLDITFQ